MRNLHYSNKTEAEIKTVMTTVGARMRDGKNNKNRTNFAAVRSQIEGQFDNYSNCFRNNDLEHINNTLGLSDEQKDTVKYLYESGKTVTSQLWRELERLNGGITILCPICGHGFALELDHYVPREKYCEFSLHLWNLIPLCHDCNHNKGVLWLDDNGKRIIFNAYIDQPSSNDFWKVDVIVQNGFPFVKIKVDKTKVLTEGDKIEFRTIEALKLCAFYEDCVNSNLRDTICEILQDRITYPEYTHENLWNEKVKQINGYLRNTSGLKTEKLLEYKALLTTEFSSWILKKKI